jgi:hypothetical protein
VLRVRDPGSEMREKSRSESGTNILDHVSESLETNSLVQIFKFFYADADADPGAGNLFDPGSEIRNGKKSDLGSGIGDKHRGATLLKSAHLGFRMLIN